ncbi:MAG TPA: hypothetical protein VF189_05785 [Patescibacteria group bacterium]
MTKKYISQLVSASYTKEKLDKGKVERIVKLLNRSELKLYIRGLKLVEKTKTISLVLPDTKLYNTTKKVWENKFKGKKINVSEDKSLLLGVKVIDNDNVYDMSLKNNLSEFVDTI